MNIPKSVASALPQPDVAIYATDALALFKTYTRDSYFAEFGEQAPAWDPSRPTKTWFDSAAGSLSPSAPRAYAIVSQDGAGNWTQQTITLTAHEAESVNLPGAVVYPQYQSAPTKATRGGQSLNPLYMVLETDALSLMAEVGGSGLFDEGAISRNPITDPAAVYPADEPRRRWAFQVNGQQCYAGLLLSVKYALGVGWPGHWDFSRGYLQWVSDPTVPTGESDTRPPVPMPIRSLLPNERLQAGPMGMGVMVVRTDMQATASQPTVFQPTSTAAAGFTAEDRNTLKTILAIVSSKN